jgi:hypothetical protein
VTKQQKVRPWWRTDSAGHLFMSIRFGRRLVEFEKGKSAVAVPSKDKLPKLQCLGSKKVGEPSTCAPHTDDGSKRAKSPEWTRISRLVSRKQENIRGAQ